MQSSGSPSAFSIVFGLLVLAPASLAAVAREDVRTQTAQYQVRIDSMPLDESLQEFARQSGLQIVFLSSVTAGVTAPPLAGSYSVPAALAQLLEGTDLTFRVISPRTIEVHRAATKGNGSARPSGDRRAAVAAQEPASPTVTVWKPAAMEEVLVQGTAEQVATRVPTPLREIPQSVAIVSREQIRQQNDTTLADVLSHAPGISTRRLNSLDQEFYSRGFQITSFHVDGGAALSPFVLGNVSMLTSPDLGGFDRAEVLRGSDALFAGDGDPGGTVSLVRKRASAVSAVELSANAGAWNDYRFALDATGPLAAGGALRGRVDASYARSDYFYDTANRERKRIFGVLEYDLTADSTLSAGGSYQWNDALPVMGGLPLYADGVDSKLPRDTSMAFDWAFYRARTSEVYLQYRQRLAPDWNLKVNAAAWHASIEFGFAEFVSLVNPRTHGIDVAPSSLFTTRPNRNVQRTIDVTLTGAMNWFGVRQELAAGVDFTRFRMQPHAAGYGRVGLPLSDVRNFDPADYPDPRLTNPRGLGVDNETLRDHYGAFASLRAMLSPRWSASLGARIASDQVASDTWVSFGPITVGPVSANSRTDRVVTPFAALVYRLGNHYSWYASYADIYKSGETAQKSDGTRLGPAHGVNLETGIKGAWRDGALNATLALYRIAQRNVPVDDPDPPPPGVDTLRCCVIGGMRRSHGGDLEVSGELTRDWLIGAGYTYNVNEDATGGALPTSTPRHLFKLWTSTRLPGALSQWTVGGNVHAQSRATGGSSNYCSPEGTCIGFAVIQPAYAVADLRVGFDIGKNWQATLTVNNLLDKNYYESIDRPSLRAWYGEPRSLMLRVDGTFPGFN